MGDHDSFNAEQTGDPTLAKPGKTWLQRFLNRFPEVSSVFGSNLDRHHALAGSSGPITDHLHMLKQALEEYNFLPENFYNTCRTVRKLFAEQEDVVRGQCKIEHMS